MPSVTPVPGKPNLLLGAYDIADLGLHRRRVLRVRDGHFVRGGDGASRMTSPPRIVALTPIDAAKFNGTVLVEWLNVSGGIDASAVWFMAHREIVREGYAYVVVSAQQVGVARRLNHHRLRHVVEKAGPRTVFDSQPSWRRVFVRHLQSDRPAGPRDGRTRGSGEFKPESVVAVGESQSAVFLTTYINSVDSHAKVYDGFLVHSRFGVAAPLDEVYALEGLRAGDLGSRSVPGRFACAGDERHHRNRPGRRRSGGLLPGQAAR